MISILIADDHAGLRTALRMVLELEADFRVVGEATDSSTAMEMALDSVPDILVADVGMPGPDSIELAANLRHQIPLTDLILLGHDEDPKIISGTLKAGAKAYVNKEWINEGLVSVIRDVADCRSPMPVDSLFDQSLRLRPLAAPSMPA
jgi:DNA-binding NarL/FixJ family response regulator